MSAEPLVLTGRQVAHLLGFSWSRFARIRAALIATHGFPPPLPGLGLRWDPKAVRAWIERPQTRITFTPDLRDEPPTPPAPLPLRPPAGQPVQEVPALAELVDWSSELTRRAGTLKPPGRAA